MKEIIGQEQNKEILEKAIDLNLSTLLIGDTGTGKTSIVNELAEKQSHTMVRVNLNGQTSTDELLGKYLIKSGATYWQDGILIEALKNGWWLLIDEINAALPEVLFALHSLLDDDRKIILSEKDGEIVTPHPDFRFFATMNPSDEYAGTKELNKALLSRFPIVLYFDFIDQSQEMKLLQTRCGIDASTATVISSFANTIRKMKTEEKLFYTFSTRDLIYWGNFIKDLGMLRAFEVTILNRAHSIDKAILIEQYRKDIGKLDGVLRERKFKTVGDMLLDFEKREAKVKEDEKLAKEIIVKSKEEATKIIKEAKEMETGVFLKVAKDVMKAKDEVKAEKTEKPKRVRRTKAQIAEDNAKLEKLKDSVIDVIPAEGAEEGMPF